MNPVSIYDHPFSSYMAFWDKCTEWPKICFKQNNLKGSPVQNISVYGQLFFLSYRSMASHFWVATHLENSAPNDHKINLNTTRWNVPHICVTSVYNNQISVSFALRPAVFDLQAILRKLHRNDPKMTLNPTRSMHPTCVASIRESQISLRFVLRPALIDIQATLRQVHWMTPKWPWTLQG